MMKKMEELEEESKISKEKIEDMEKKMNDMEKESKVSKDVADKKVEDPHMKQYLTFAAGAVANQVLGVVVTHVMSIVIPDALASFYATLPQVKKTTLPKDPLVRRLFH